jgi:hypothetical protein
MAMTAAVAPRSSSMEDFIMAGEEYRSNRETRVESVTPYTMEV